MKDSFQMHTRLIAMNIFAFIVVLFMVLMFIEGLKSVSKTDIEISNRFFAVESKIQKSEVKLRRLDDIKRQIIAMETEWPYIVGNISILMEIEKRVKHIGPDVTNMKETVRAIGKKIRLDESTLYLMNDPEVKSRLGHHSVVDHPDMFAADPTPTPKMYEPDINQPVSSKGSRNTNYGKQKGPGTI